MKIKTQLFQDACKTILLAVEDSSAALELKGKGDGSLYLDVTNKEYYVSVRYATESQEEFRAVVNAQLFLNLVAGITTEDFDIDVKENYVQVKSGKSKYKVAMIYENDALMELAPIFVENKTVEMTIPNAVLKSIVNVNSKELLKVKNLDVNPLQRYYYIDETGCFTFTTGACMNSFSLEKPVKMLLNDKTVKLFKLFKEDVSFSFGYDESPTGTPQTKAVFETPDVYLAVLVPNDDLMLSKIQGPCQATKQYIAESYPVKAVVSANALSAALSRLMVFTKNSVDKVNMMSIFGSIDANADELIISDKLGNVESVKTENGSYLEKPYSMCVNLSDFKLALDACKDEYITMNCGNGKSVVLTRGAISNLIPESRRREAANA